MSKKVTPEKLHEWVTEMTDTGELYDSGQLGAPSSWVDGDVDWGTLAEKINSFVEEKDEAPTV